MSQAKIPFTVRALGVTAAVLAAAMAMFIPVDSARSATAEDPATPVYLNHFFVVLDAEAYAALSASDFIRNEFAGFEQRTTATGDGDSWSGTYLYGEKTYIELFEATEDEWFERWSCGIAFCVETAGAIESVAQALERNLESAEVNYYPRTMMTEQKDEVPWFQVAQPVYEGGEAQHALSTWVMEYHPGFLNTIDSQLYPAPGDISRREYLKRFFVPERYFRDIVAVRLALHPQRAETFIRELEAFGWKINADGEETVCEGPEVTFRVSKKAAAVGPVITEVEFSLLKAKDGRKVYSFGDSAVLEFGEGLSAVLKFK